MDDVVNVALHSVPLALNGDKPIQIKAIEPLKHGKTSSRIYAGDAIGG